MAQVGETWQRRHGREVVRVGRVWEICACSYPVMHGFDPEHGAGPVEAVRLHPTRGGQWWWTVMPEFLVRFDWLAAGEGGERDA
jgi:hypothetical protein